MSQVEDGRTEKRPLKDRQMALALILELALQHGTLQQILEAVLLLLRLSGLVLKESSIRSIPTLFHVLLTGIGWM